MGNGPRDWSPPGYWDDKPNAGAHRSDRWNAPTVSSASSRRRGRRAWSVLSALLGLAALVLVLVPLFSRDANPRLIWATVGLSAIFLGITHLVARRRYLADGRALASIGIGTGAVATALMAWGVLWVELRSMPAPPQVAFSGVLAPAEIDTVALPPAQPAQQAGVDPAPVVTPNTTAPSAAPKPVADDRGYELRAGRAMPPVPNAKPVTAEYQLQANLVVTAYEICVALDSYRTQRGANPPSLTVGGDGRISAADVVFGTVLPAYMRLSYAPASPDGAAYVTVADIESGMAMSCVRSGDEGWITNS